MGIDVIDVKKVVEKLRAIGAKCRKRRDVEYYLCTLQIPSSPSAIEVKVGETSVEASIPGEFCPEDMLLEEFERSLFVGEFEKEFSEKLGLEVELDIPAELNLRLRARDTESALRLVNAVRSAAENNLYVVVTNVGGDLICKSGDNIITCRRMIELLTGG